MKILVIDDEESSIWMVRNLLEGVPDVELASFTKLAAGIQQIDTWHPDITLIDLRFPESTMDDTIALIPKICHKTAVVCFTGFDDDKNTIWTDCINAGAYNFLQKDYYFNLRRKEAFMHALVNSWIVFKAQEKKGQNVTR